MTPAPALQLHDVFCLHRGGEGDSAALQGLSLELGAGERVCVIGPSGAGKTTLLRICAGLQAPSAGEVRLFGCDLWRVSGRRRAQLRRTHLGVLDQHAERALAPDLTAAQAIALPLALRGAGRRAARARAAELLTACGLADRAEARPSELSGGERQRIALCAALAHRPRLLLADEPTAKLDAGAGAELTALIDALARDHGAAVLLVSHDPALAVAIPRAIRLRDGRIASERGGGAPALAVDRGGWIRLPGSLRRRAGVGAVVSARVSGAAIVLRSTEAPADAVIPEPSPTIAAPRRPVSVSVIAVGHRYGDGPAQRTVLAGTNIAALGPEQRAALRRERIGYLRQEPAPIGHLSAVENVGLAVALHRRAVSGTAGMARDLLTALGLGARADRRVSGLSAGEAQRVALAMAVAGVGGVLIADEPTSRLDRESAGRAIRVLLACAAAGHTVICATHDPEVIAAAAVVRLGAVSTVAATGGTMPGSRPLPTPEIP